MPARRSMLPDIWALWTVRASLTYTRAFGQSAASSVATAAQNIRQTRTSSTQHSNCVRGTAVRKFRPTTTSPPQKLLLTVVHRRCSYSCRTLATPFASRVPMLIFYTAHLSWSASFVALSCTQRRSGYGRGRDDLSKQLEPKN